MSFINDEEKLKDLFELSRKDFLSLYSNVTEDEYQTIIDDLWEDFAYIDIDEQENTLEKWKMFPKGIFREEIWHWFDERVIGGIGNRYFN